MTTTLQIRNSTAEFLIFQLEDKANGIEVFYKDETLWASQKAIAVHEKAVQHAETEFEKYRIVQDRLYQSDFDRLLQLLSENE